MSKYSELQSKIESAARDARDAADTLECLDFEDFDSEDEIEGLNYRIKVHEATEALIKTLLTQTTQLHRISRAHKVLTGEAT